MTISPLARKWYKIGPYLLWNINRSVIGTHRYTIKSCRFWWPWVTFKGKTAGAHFWDGSPDFMFVPFARQQPNSAWWPQPKGPVPPIFWDYDLTPKKTVTRLCRVSKAEERRLQGPSCRGKGWGGASWSQSFPVFNGRLHHLTES